MLSVFLQTPPAFSKHAALKILKKKYNLTGTIKILYSDRDQNFLLITDSAKYILKIFNQCEKMETVDLQISAMNFIADSSFPFEIPRPIGSAHKIIKHEIDYIVCLFGYVEGNFLYESELLSNDYISMGNFMGNLSKVLENFNHPGASRNFEWDIQNLEILRERVQYIEQRNNRDIVNRVIDRYVKTVIPKINFLRKSVIHNDGNDRNIIINKNNRVKGIIDFGDMVHSFTALEAAVCMSYVGQNTKKPFDPMFDFLTGFRSKYPLHHDEICSILPMVCIRLCISLTMSAWRKKLFPENHYLIVSEHSSWVLLKYLQTMNLESCIDRYLKNEN